MASLKIGNMIMRSLFGEPATLMYPKAPREWKERTRGRIEIEVDGCVFCGFCARKCPADAIKVDREAKSWAIERMGCVQCNACVEGCPSKCLKNAAGYAPPDTAKTVETFVKE